MSENELPTSTLSKVIARETDMHTYIQTYRQDRNYVPRRFAGGHLARMHLSSIITAEHIVCKRRIAISLCRLSAEWIALYMGTEA